MVNAMRALVVLVAGLLSFISSSASAAPSADAVVYVRIEVIATGQDRTRGSGFLIDRSGLGVTARHVVENFNPNTERLWLHLKSRDAYPVPGKVLRCAPGALDVCLIWTKEENIKANQIVTFPKLSCRPLVRDEPIVVIGYPFGQENPILTRRGAISGALASGSIYPTSAPFVQGMSGSPVFDRNDSVIGIAYGGADKAPTLTFVTPLHLLARDFLPAHVPCPAQTAPPDVATSAPPASAPDSKIIATRTEQICKWLQNTTIALDKSGIDKFRGAELGSGGTRLRCPTRGGQTALPRASAIVTYSFKGGGKLVGPDSCVVETYPDAHCNTVVCNFGESKGIAGQVLADELNARLQNSSCLPEASYRNTACGTRESCVYRNFQTGTRTRSFVLEVGPERPPLNQPLMTGEKPPPNSAVVAISDE